MYKPEIFKFSHREVCDRAAKWVKANMNMGLVFVEHKTMRSREIPDVLGLRSGGRIVSFMFEVKVDRSDFTQDKNKPHRNGTVPGIGDYRFYVAPQGMIKVYELPKGWGLIEYTKGGRFLKTHVPHSVKCLYEPESYREHLKEEFDYLHSGGRYGKSRDQLMYHMRAIRNLRDTLKFCFFTKNFEAEYDLLYGAMRQYVIANEKGLPINPQVIFQRPFDGVQQTAMTCKG